MFPDSFCGISFVIPASEKAKPIIFVQETHVALTCKQKIRARVLRIAGYYRLNGAEDYDDPRDCTNANGTNIRFCTNACSSGKLPALFPYIIKHAHWFLSLWAKKAILGHILDKIGISTRFLESFDFVLGVESDFRRGVSGVDLWANGSPGAEVFNF